MDASSESNQDYQEEQPKSFLRRINLMLILVLLFIPLSTQLCASLGMIGLLQPVVSASTGSQFFADYSPWDTPTLLQINIVELATVSANGTGVPSVPDVTATPVEVSITPVDSPTNTLVLETPTQELVATNTPLPPSPTNTVVVRPTNTKTPVPTATWTPRPTSTNTPVPPPPPTNTPLPSATPVTGPSPTATRPSGPGG